MKRGPCGLRRGGGSKGALDHLRGAMPARVAGVSVQQLNYEPCKGGGEAAAALLGGHVGVAASGWGETRDLVARGQLRALAITAPARLPRVPVPTLREQGIAVEIANWRGLHAAPGLDAAQREAIGNAVATATHTSAWTRALASHDWTPDLLQGEEYERFVADEHVRL